MAIRRPNGVSQLDFDGAINLVVKVLTDSGVPQKLQAALDLRLGRGRPNSLPRYTVMAVLGTLFHLVYCGLPASIANVMRCLWLDYTVDQLTALGLPPDWRDSARRDAMLSTDVWDDEYKRLQAAVVDMLLPIDDTPYRANGGITNAEAKQAVADNSAALQPLTDARHRAMNDIIAATVPIDLFRYFEGDLATDLHNFITRPNPHKNPLAPNRKKSSPPLAGWVAHAKRFAGADGFGLSLAIAVNKPGNPEIPDIALGVGTSPSAAADLNSTLIAIDAADRLSIMPKRKANARQTVTGDKAYPYTRGFTAAMNDRGRIVVGDFREGQEHVIDLQAAPHDTDFPRLFNGCIVCPGIPRALLEQADPRLHETYDNMTPEQLLEVDRLYQRIQAGQMPTNGRPVRGYKRGPGRPRKNDPTQHEAVFKVEVFCPARRGNLRCPRVPESMTLPVDHQATPSEGSTSWVCAGNKTQLTISEKDFKNYSAPYMAGTLDHHSIYKHARAHNEGFHAYIVSPDSGNLKDRSVRVRRNSEISILVAFAIATSNIRSADAFRAGARRNGGTNPQQARAKWIEWVRTATGI